MVWCCDLAGFWVLGFVICIAMAFFFCFSSFWERAMLLMRCWGTWWVVVLHCMAYDTYGHVFFHFFPLALAAFHSCSKVPLLLSIGGQSITLKLRSSLRRVWSNSANAAKTPRNLVVSGWFLAPRSISRLPEPLLGRTSNGGRSICDRLSRDRARGRGIDVHGDCL